MSSDFSLCKAEPTIRIESEAGILDIIKDEDENIIFKSNKNSFSLDINYYTEEFDEWQTFHIFNDFFHRVVGKYYIEGMGSDSYPPLPQDFINADNKTIVYHSDNTNINNSLLFTSSDNKLNVSLRSSGQVRPAKVVVSKKDSNYDGYYREFNKLYTALCAIAPEQKENSETEKTYTKN